MARGTTKKKAKKSAKEAKASAPAKKKAAKKKSKAKASAQKKPKKTKGKKDDGLASTASSRKRSAAKRRAALDAVSTSARMAVKARESVFSISSEKTLEQIHAGETMQVVAEAGRMERLASLVPDSLPPSDIRRCSRDPFGGFRNELLRDEDEASDPHATWRHQNRRLRHEMSIGASPEQLAEVEAKLKTKLSPSYYDFCLEWNGGLLYVNEGGALRVIAADDLIDEIKGPICERMHFPHLPAIDLGCGDYLAFDMSKTNRSGENPLYWWYAGEQQRKVADSFALFLKRLVEARGESFWWDL